MSESALHPKRPERNVLIQKLGTDRPAKVVVLRALHLGDLLCSIPAFRALKRALPESEITLVGLPWARELATRYPYIDRFIEFPGFPGLPERPFEPGRFREFLEKVQRERFNVAIQMQGCGTLTNPLTLLFGAEISTGFYRPGEFCPHPERFLAFPEPEPEIWRQLRLMQFLGIPLQGEDLEFPLRSEDFAELDSIPEARLEQGSYVCLHPGARASWRLWATENFAAVGDALMQRGLQVVLTGSAGERELAERVASQMRRRPINLAGRTTLGALAALLQRSQLLICNDTGVSHLAVALRLPSIVVFNRSLSEGWPPLDQSLHRVLCRVSGVTPKDVLTDALARPELAQRLVQLGGARCVA